MRNENIIHVIDPDWAIGEALGALLGTYGIDVQIFTDAESYLSAMKGHEANPRCVLIEIDLPGMTGLSLLQRLRTEQAHVPHILLTSSDRSEVDKQARQLGAIDVVRKPLMNGFLLERLALVFSNLTNQSDN